MTLGEGGLLSCTLPSGPAENIGTVGQDLSIQPTFAEKYRFMKKDVIYGIDCIKILVSTNFEIIPLGLKGLPIRCCSAI